jgi:hypothetical protein
MTPLFNFAQTSTYDLTPSHLRLPPFIWTTFTTLNYIHGIWRWYRRIDLYRNPDNLAQLLAGHAVNIAFGDALLLRVAAQCLLVATRLLDAARQQAAVCRSGRRLIAAIKGDYPKPLLIEWDRKCHSWLSPSTVYWWQSSTFCLRERVQRIAACIFELLIKTFKLSMKIMDVIDAFCWSPSTKNEGVTESFINITKWLEAVIDQKEELLTGLTNNQAVIEKILKNSPITYSQLNSVLLNALEKTEAVFKGVKKLSTLGNGACINFGKQAVGGGMVVIGLANYRPTTLARNKTQ